MKVVNAAGLFIVAGVLFVVGGLLNGRSPVAVGAFFLVLGIALRKRST